MQNIDTTTELYVITELQPVWLQQVCHSCDNDEECQKLISQILLDSTSGINSEYQFVQGILKKQGKIYLGSNGEIRNQVISALHDSSLGGHSGQTACLQRLKLVFYWPKMKQDVVDWIQKCEVCQRNKVEHIASPGLLQPLEIPNVPWKHF